MSESKVSAHTPGPWKVVGESSDHECGYGVSSVGTRDEGVFRICNTDMDELEMPEQLANARLIAAAPDMLEALKAARAVMKATYNLPQFAWLPGYNGRTFDENLMLIEEAIRKAIAVSSDKA